MITVGGVRATKIALRWPWSHCWEASAELAGPAPSGSVVIDWRGWRLLGGEVDPLRSATFQGQGRVVVVGGLRWSTMLAPREYSADNGVRAGTVARDAANAVGGLQIAVDDSVNRVLGKYWPRRRETGGSVLTRLFGRSWRVDLDGVTRAGARQAAVGRAVEVLTYEAHDRVVTLAAERPDAAPLGAVLRSPRLPTPRRVTEVHARADGASERLWAYTQEAA